MGLDARAACSKEDMARRFKANETSRESWRSLVEEPLGNAIERYLRDDVVRGLVFTDAKIGVFTSRTIHR